MEGASRGAFADLHERFVETVDGLQGGDGLAELAGQLGAVVHLLTRELRLRRALTDPSMPAEGRQGLLDRVLGDQVSDTTRALLREAVGKRWTSVSDILEALDRLFAEAVLLRAEADGDLDEVEDELFRFGRVVNREPRLSLALSDAALPTDRKVGLLEALLADRAHAATRQLIEHIVTDPLGRSVEAAAEEYEHLAAEIRQRYVAVVRTARPLDDDQAQRLRDVLGQIYGRDIQLQVQVDESVIGGLSVHIRDEVIDGTVAHRLDAVRRRLAG